jgi:hypothetical protein
MKKRKIPFRFLFALLSILLLISCTKDSVLDAPHATTFSAQYRQSELLGLIGTYHNEALTYIATNHTWVNNTAADAASVFEELNEYFSPYGIGYEEHEMDGLIDAIVNDIDNKELYTNPAAYWESFRNSERASGLSWVALQYIDEIYSIMSEERADLAPGQKLLVMKQDLLDLKEAYSTETWTTNEHEKELVEGTLNIALASSEFWSVYQNPEIPADLIVQVDALAYLGGWGYAYFIEEDPNSNSRIKKGLWAAGFASSGGLIK